MLLKMWGRVLINYLFLWKFSAYLLKLNHVCAGFIKQNIFATKSPRHEV